jgi:hypothetical protein
VADITYIPTWSGWLYLAVVLDVWSRRIVGWAMADHLRPELVVDALTWPSGAAGLSRAWFITAIRAAKADSTGRRNTPSSGGVDGTTTGLGCCGDRKAADAVAWPAAGGAA